MLNHSHRQLDTQLVGAMDRVGLVGQQLRESLLRDFKSKIVLRSAKDAVEVIGASGTGRRKVIEAAHEVARDVLGRSGDLHEFDCARGREGRLDGELASAITAASGGTLVLDRFGTLDAEQMTRATRVIRNHSADALILAVSERGPKPGAATPRPATAIRLKPLHERDEDVWELIAHFFATTAEDCDIDGCRGFSRQAKGDIAEVVRETNLKSVRRLRDIVRDLVFENLAEGPLPLKLTSDQVRPYLERSFGQTQSARVAHDKELVASQLDALIEVEPTMLQRLAEIHGVSKEVLLQQAQVLRAVKASVTDIPQSYRNVMTRSEDVQRAAMWLVSGATTQAGFRRFFGDEGFMRPTKSVAWAFYNRVFKRDM